MGFGRSSLPVSRDETARFTQVAWILVTLPTIRAPRSAEKDQSRKTRKSNTVLVPVVRDKHTKASIFRGPRNQCCSHACPRARKWFSAFSKMDIEKELPKDMRAASEDPVLCVFSGVRTNLSTVDGILHQLGWMKLQYKSPTSWCTVLRIHPC